MADNNVGPIIGAALGIAALGVAIKATKGLTDMMQDQSQKLKTGKKKTPAKKMTDENERLYHKIWG